jgi:hypothetical protein
MAQLRWRGLRAIDLVTYAVVVPLRGSALGTTEAERQRWPPPGSGSKG